MLRGTAASLRELAQAFTPAADRADQQAPVQGRLGGPAFSPRDRSSATRGAVVALYRPDELPAQLRARDNGVTREEIAALITHIAFHAGFPAAISAPIIASSTLSE